MHITIDVDVRLKDGTLALTDSTGKDLKFSKEQIVQKKVNMVTLGELSGLSKLNIAKAFGFRTRKSYYDIRKAVLHGTTADLLPKRTGPQQPQKRTKEVEALIIRYRFESNLNMYEIADEINKMGFNVSSRLVGEVLAEHGLSKKKG